LLFTPERASEAGRKSGEARRLKRANRQKNGQATKPAPEIETNLEPAETNVFAVANLKRVRKQLDRLFDDLDGAIEGTTVEEGAKGKLQVINPAGIDRLCAAISRVSELERQWAGRSLPPTLRAPPERRQRGPGRSIEVWTAPPALPTPQPVVNSAPQSAQPPTPTPQDGASH
jgi:hypothetical protein